MISRTTNGCPRPVGSTFRQREVWAEHSDATGKRCVPWVVSVAETKGGEAVEAKRHHATNTIVAIGPREHSALEDVLAKTLELLDANDGWRHREVESCEIDGCHRPLPMWAHFSRTTPGQKRECLVCATRTVLACSECGMPDDVEVTNRERLLADSLCFGCSMWRDRLAGPPEVVAQDWTFYGIGDGRGPKEMRGHAGAEFVVTFTDGRRVETDDLWNGGVIPEWFRDRFTPNASVKRAQRKADSR